MEIQPDPVHTVVITPAPTANVAAGVEIPFTAEARDQYGNLITNNPADFTWTNTTTGIFNQTVVGQYNVTAEFGGVISATTLVTVTPGPVATIVIFAPLDTVVPGEELVFTAEAFDMWGNLITDNVEDFTWENATNGVFNEMIVGEYNVTAEYGGVVSNVFLVTVFGDTSSIIHLLPGWNLISLDRQNVTGTLASDFMAAAGPSCLFIVRWNATQQAYDATYPGTDFLMEMGVGYWVYMNTSADVEIWGLDKDIVGFEVYELATNGWNLIGWFNTTTMKASTFCELVNDTYRWGYKGPIGGWNATLQAYDAGYVYPWSSEKYNFELTPTKGYWLWINTVTEHAY